MYIWLTRGPVSQARIISGALLGSGALGTRWSILKMPVPTGMGTPVMMHSETPAIASVRACTAASYL